eukprot:2510188-Alexandrium_andersonii.AAC.1
MMTTATYAALAHEQIERRLPRNRRPRAGKDRPQMSQTHRRSQTRNAATQTQPAIASAEQTHRRLTQPQAPATRCQQRARRA